MPRARRPVRAWSNWPVSSGEVRVERGRPTASYLVTGPARPPMSCRPASSPSSRCRPRSRPSSTGCSAAICRAEAEGEVEIDAEAETPEPLRRRQARPRRDPGRGAVPGAGSLPARAGGRPSPGRVRRRAAAAARARPSAALAAVCGAIDGSPHEPRPSPSTRWAATRRRASWSTAPLLALEQRSGPALPAVRRRATARAAARQPRPAARAGSTVRHTPDSVAGDAKPSHGAAPGPQLQHAARDQRGEGGRGRGRGLGRQHRRPDGDGQVRAQDPARDRSAGDRLGDAGAAAPGGDPRSRRQRRMRRRAPVPVRGHGRGLRARDAGRGQAARRPAQCRHRGAQGRRRRARRRGDAAREHAADRLPRLRRGHRRHRGRGRRRRDRRLHRQRRPEDRRGHGRHVHRPRCARRFAAAGCGPSSATCWPSRPSPPCASSSIRGATTAPCSWA